MQHRYEDEAAIFTLQLDCAAPDTGGPLAGLSVSIKDNIDVAGITTTAAAVAFASRPAAKEDASVVKRLRNAGARIFAKTNMSEFAYSTLGVNAHFGTPRNPHPFDGEARIPGGSSSGAAVATALGLGNAAIGTDTAGSARIPAALCGVVGFKPRQRRIPLDGIVPVSFSYDCVGIFAQTVPEIARVFNAIANTADEPQKQQIGNRSFRLLVPIDTPTSELAPSPEVAAAFESALAVLGAKRRFEIVRQPFGLFRAALAMSSEGGIAAPEAYAFHKPFLETMRSWYDPFTLYRLSFGEKCSAERYINLLARRRELMSQCAAQMAAFDAVAYPTCPIIAPTLASLADPEVKINTNTRLLQNTIAANVLDLPSISIPCGHLATAPVGLSLDSVHSEERLLYLAAQVEETLRSAAKKNSV